MNDLAEDLPVPSSRLFQPLLDPGPAAERERNGGVDDDALDAENDATALAPIHDCEDRRSVFRNFAAISFRKILQNLSPGDMRTVSYELYDSEFWNQRKRGLQQEEEERRRRRLSIVACAEHERRLRLLHNLAILGIGVATASVGSLITWSSDRLETSYWRHLGPAGLDTATSAASYGRYLGFALLFALLALVPVACVRPVAAGSGIAEAKAVLNGIKIPRCTGLLSAACKGASVVCAMASSLPVGLEGPLIFIGMALGENVYRLLPQRYTELRSWRMRRDFAAVGTAAGVAAAFLAPIGGILFAAEEGASYVTARLLTRCFAAAITVVVCLVLYRSVLGQDPSYPLGQVLEKFSGDSATPAETTFALIDYPVIALVGVFGGVLGACFVEGSKFLSRLRTKHVRTQWRKVAEILALALLASTLLAWLPSLPQISDCRPLERVRSEKRFFKRMDCPNDDEYNELGTLLRQPLPYSINLLFWEDRDSFSPTACVVAGVTILLLLLLTFGASISMGIFVPLLFVGANFGRALSLLLSTKFDVSTYAIVGAAACLNGVVRVLVSLCVILIETTDQAALVSPLMIVCLVSRWVGHLMFQREGIYDEIIEMRGIPFLEAEPPEITRREVLRARDIMSTEFIQLDPVMSVADILRALQKYNQRDFLVTSSDGVLLGAISRSTLITVIWNKSSWSKSADQLCYDDFDFGRWETVTDKELADHFEHVADECEHLLNIAHFMSLAPITFSESGSAERAYELFRTHGLRLLIIIDGNELKPVGVIKRSNILEMLESQENEEAVTCSEGEGLQQEEYTMS